MCLLSMTHAETQECTAGIMNMLLLCNVSPTHSRGILMSDCTFLDMFLFLLLYIRKTRFYLDEYRVNPFSLGWFVCMALQTNVLSCRYQLISAFAYPVTFKIRCDNRIALYLVQLSIWCFKNVSQTSTPVTRAKHPNWFLLRVGNWESYKLLVETVSSVHP